VCVVLTRAGYPREFAKGRPIDGLESLAALPDVKAFHSGTRRGGAGWETSGGRVVGVTARGRDLAEARARAYDAARRVRFEGVHFRSDVAQTRA